MRKSSLGRRSSVSQIPVRLSSTGGSSGQTLCSGGRKRSGSLIRQPGFSQSKRRSQSEDRESTGVWKTMARSNTSGAVSSLGLGAMTPITPRHTINSNLPTGSARPSRGDAMSTESNRRMSSFGGAKNSRKDPRPISEKAFQQAAQSKVQQYFDLYGTDIIGAGQSIRPMTTNLFINMIDHLLKYFDSRHVITKSNYLEELPIVLRKLGYKSKLDRSWMMTVNTPHSWQHVIALLSWVVDAIECMECIDPWTLMYNNNFELENELNDCEDLPIDPKVIAHFKAVYKIRNDPNRDAEMEDLGDEFVGKMIIEENCTDEDFEVMDKQIHLIEQDLQKFEEKYHSHQQHIEELKVCHDSLVKDQEEKEHFIAESEAFDHASKAKVDSISAEISNQNIILQRKTEELHKVLEKVKGQTMTLEEKEKLTSERHELLRRIQFHENSIRGYEKSSFTVDLKLAEGLRKLDSLLVDYRTSVAENIVLDSRLKSVDLDMSAFQLNEGVLQTVGENLISLKEEGKKSLSELNAKKEKSEKFLLRINHNIKETGEKIAKEKTLLEGVESDLKQHQDQVAKKSQKLKEEAMRHEKLAKEISEEIAQFDPSKLEEKRTELTKMEHDMKLLKERQDKYFKGMLANFKEAQERLKGPMQRAEEAKERLRKTLEES